MKKVLASTLAILMAASMTSVGFADDNKNEATNIFVDSTSNLFVSDDDKLVSFNPSNSVKPGESIYIQLLAKDEAGANATNIPSKLVNSHKVSVEWDQGKDLVDSMDLVNKKVSITVYKLKAGETKAADMLDQYDTKADLDTAIDAAILADNTLVKSELEGKYQASTTTKYQYMAEITLKKSYTVEMHDLLGSVKVMKKSFSSSHEAPSIQLNTQVGYKSASADDTLEVTNDNPVISFENYNDESELIFGTLASFVVNAKNQEKDLYLGYSLKPQSDIIDQNEEANIDFISFDAKPTFNRIGELRLFADEGSFLYERTSKGLKALNAKYDSDLEAYILETRTLGNYVISDVELNFTVDNTPDEDDGSGNVGGAGNGNTGNGGSDNSSKPSNPGTGAADLGMAGLSGLSLLAAIFAGKKKFF